MSNKWEGKGQGSFGVGTVDAWALEEEVGSLSVDVDVGEANWFVATGSLFSQQWAGGIGLTLAIGIVGQGGVDGVSAGVEGTEQDPGCAVPRSA